MQLLVRTNPRHHPYCLFGVLVQGLHPYRSFGVPVQGHHPYRSFGVPVQSLDEILFGESQRTSRLHMKLTRRKPPPHRQDHDTTSERKGMTAVSKVDFVAVATKDKGMTALSPNEGAIAFGEEGAAVMSKDKPAIVMRKAEVCGR